MLGAELAERDAQPCSGRSVVGDAAELKIKALAQAQTGTAQQQDRRAGEHVIEGRHGGHPPASASGASARGSGRGRRGTSLAKMSRRLGRSAYPHKVMSSRKFRTASTAPCPAAAETRWSRATRPCQVRVRFQARKASMWWRSGWAGGVLLAPGTSRMG